MSGPTLILTACRTLCAYTRSRLCHGWQNFEESLMQMYTQFLRSLFLNGGISPLCHLANQPSWLATRTQTLIFALDRCQITSPGCLALPSPHTDMSLRRAPLPLTYFLRRLQLIQIHVLHSIFVFQDSFPCRRGSAMPPDSGATCLSRTITQLFTLLLLFLVAPATGS